MNSGKLRVKGEAGAISIWLLPQVDLYYGLGIKTAILVATPVIHVLEYIQKYL